MPDAQQHVEESQFVVWARDELRRAGLFEQDSDYGGMLGDEVMKMIETFSEAGHSGFSAAMAADIFARLSAWKPLTPVTNDPSEWMHVEESVAGDAITWQSRRSPGLFSRDGGKTYYDIDERPSALRRLARRLTRKPLLRLQPPPRRTEEPMAQETKHDEVLKASDGWTPARLSEMAYQAAGACSAVFLQKHPEDVMPTQEISEGVERILADFGIDTAASDA